MEALKNLNRGKKLLTPLPMIELVEADIAVLAGYNFRTLRSLGITVRKNVDTLIATSGIKRGLALLYSDKDFDLFAEPLGLQSAMSAT